MCPNNDHMTQNFHAHDLTATMHVCGQYFSACMLAKVKGLESEGCTTFTAISARQSRIMIVLSKSCNFHPPRFSLTWRRGTLSSPGHPWFASSAEAEVLAGASARSRAATVRPGCVSENWFV